MGENNPYPTDSEIRDLLRPRMIKIAKLCTAILMAGIALDLSGIVTRSFPRSGSITLAIVLFYYFYLEKNEFLTGHKGELFDSAQHYIARKIAAPFIMWLSFIGTLVWGLGDIPVCLIRSGEMAC